MVKSRKLPAKVLDHMAQVENHLAVCDEVIFAYLFGSLAAGRQNPLSDIDIAVYLTRSADRSESRLALLGDLIQILRTDKIDLVVINSAPLPLKARIIRQKAILVDKDPFLRHKFESLTLREYFDFSRKEMELLARRYSIGR